DVTYAGVDASTATATQTAIVVVLAGSSNGEELARTPVIVDPEPRHHVDLLAAEVADYTGQPEYARVLAAFEPWVSANALPNLGSDDLELLVKRTGMPADQVAMAIQAQRIATARGIPAEASYALMRAGMPADVPGQLAQPRERLRAALQAAIDGNLVSDTLANGNPFDVETLVGTYTTSKIGAVLTGTDDTLNRIIQSSALSTTQTDLFVARMSEHEGTREELWTALRAGTEFSSGEVDTLEFTLGVSELCNGSYDIVAALQVERTAGNLAAIADLTAWDESDWGSFIATHGAPDDLPGTQAERETLYAAAINRYVEEKFPTGTIARRFERDEPASEVPTFLDARPDFDIESTVIARYADANPTAFDGYATDVQAAVKSVQRVYALTPRFHRYGVTRALLDAGIDSAAQVVHQGRAGFIAQFSSVLDGLHDNMSGEDAAKAVYGAAVQKHAFSVATMAQYGASFNTLEVPSIPSKSLSPEAGDGAATLANLFGSLDYCACEHCRSMYGPAAYLVALLSSLEGATFLDELTSRRGDITALELSCINTNTPLPYIDIVNEVLEQASLELQVSGSLDGLELEARQTTWAAEELLINPEPTGFSATAGDGSTLSPYDGPAQSVFPWSLPLDLPAVEGRAYLDQLGTSRSELITLFQADGEPAERLGMTTRQFSLIAGTAVDVTPATAWGMSEGESVLSLSAELRTLLDRAALSYDELAKLLELRFINDDVSPARIDFIDTGGGSEPSCNLDDREIVAFSEAIADRMHRFVRLARTIEMDWIELDRTIATLSDGLLDEAFLIELSGMLQVRVRLRLDSDEACALWEDIGAYPYGEPFEPSPSLYTRLFQSRAVFAEPDPAFAIGALGGPILAGHHATLRAAFRINDAELGTILAGEEVAPERTLEGLSQMYRVALLSKALGISIADYYRLRALSGIDPFTNAAASLEFADLATALMDWGVSFVELDYLCRHESVGEYAVEPSLEDREAIAEGLRGAFETIEQGLVIAGDPVSVVSELVPRIDGEAQLALILERVGGDSLDYADVSEFLPTEGPWTEGAFNDIEHLIPAVQLQQRIDWVLPGIIADVIPRLRGSLREQAVFEALTDASGVARDVVERLSSSMVTADVEGTQTPVSAILQGDDSAASDAALAQFLKVAAFVASLRVGAEVLDWYFGQPTDVQAMSLASVPLSTEDDSNVFGSWNTIRRGQVNAGVFVDETNPLPEIAALLPGTHAAELAQATGWNEDDIDELLTNTLGGVDDPTTLERMRAILGAVQRTGVSVQTLGQWASDPPSALDTSAMKEALRARYSEVQWPKVIQSLSDRLRELRRTALLDYVMMNSSLTTEAAVYEHFLLDPEMNACMLTSRVKLAISAVQLFVQRALLGLEEEVTLPAGFEKDWGWKKNYRVWEANRKVFFYPENWIEPELRVGKTPFFEELEAHLQQGTLTTEHVEKGLEDYISKLHEVANLEVLDLHRTRDAGGGDVLHVLARTRSQPGKYFHRTFVNDAWWTPWSEIDVPITSRQVILRSMGSRLFVFWLEFLERSDRPLSEDEPDKRVYFDYRMSWVEKDGAGWSRPRATEVIRPKVPIQVSESEDYRALHHLWGGLEANGDGTMRVVVTVFVTSAPIVALGYDPCSDTFDVLDDVPRKGLNLLGEHFLWSRIAKSRGAIVDVRRRNPLTGASVALPLIGNVRRRTMLTFAHQDGPWPDEHYNESVPVAVGTRRYGVLAFYTPAGHVFQPRLPDLPPTPFLPAADQTPLEPFLRGAGLLGYDYQESVSPEPDEASPRPGTLALSVHGQGDPLGFEIAGQNLDETAGPVDAPGWSPGWKLKLFHHPYTCSMLNAIRGGAGVQPLLAPTSGPLWRQLQEDARFVSPDTATESDTDRLTAHVVEPYPIDHFDFSGDGAYSVYNWEAFYHAPILIADRLRREGRFEEADQWYRYVFDPRIGTVVDLDGDEVSGSSKFWRTKRLYLESLDEDVDVIQAIFSNEGLDAHPEVVEGFLKSIYRWVMSPFDPHAIASVRSGTYRWVAVRKYLDNVIDWADSLFRRDTIESLNEAAQLYLLASEILGRRPERLAEVGSGVSTYGELGLAGLFGGLAELEGFHPANAQLSPFGAISGGDGPEPPPIWWYFCLPMNPQLVSYWDTIADRLFKIRNCQNIEGVERQLALFQAPIDPALLVRARAAGLDLGDVATQHAAPISPYRFRSAAARASDLCSDIRGLGSALLSALEKRDAEALSRLRANHEVKLLRMVRRVRRDQVEEVSAQIDALTASRQTAVAREQHYATREAVSGKEQSQVDKMVSAGNRRLGQQTVQTMGSFLSSMPDLSLGIFPFSVGTSFGGSTVSAIFRGLAGAMGSKASRDEIESSLASIRGAQERRWDDWQHQVALARLEQGQIDKQIIAAEVRKAIAEKELENHEGQIEQAKEVQTFYRDKFTNKELYDWMIGEISRLYFQAYKLAFDMAKKAERSMQFELQTDDAFIDFGYWDSLKKGLMAGERLHLDIKRMESAYLEKDKRELELTKRVSLRQVAPGALAQLRESGECEFEIPELLFDLDHAGHYLRRMRAVRVTMPAVAGPQTSIGATLTLLRDDLRSDASLEDTAVRTTFGGTKRIATSHAREDGGLFELNFRDERYLPFEGAGVASRW
ncbi:MAG: hypothetical protein KUG77_21040, partial [Nannocystaceae bacterium]|nr:hypothetical protein [Nannocystaceae bacterium]